MALRNKKKKICFVITSHIHYGRSKHILEELKRRRGVELQIVVGGSAILPTYGDVLKLLREDGFPCSAKVTMTIEGGNPVAMAKTAGLGVTEFTTVFETLEPELVVLRGDRFEILSAAIAAAYLNIPVAHIEGGDVTGTIDESVRHAVTKLSHLHFATNALSRERLIRMGEHPDYVFDVGAPEIEFIARNNFRTHARLINYLGVGDVVDLKKPFLLVMNHPVTTEYGRNKENTFELLHAVDDLAIPAIWFWPNADAGTDEVSKAIRTFRERLRPRRMRFIKYLPPEEFAGLLKKSSCLVGNSSAGIKECSFLGVPVVNIGTRQEGRLRAENVLDVPRYDRRLIAEAVRRQLKAGRYRPSDIYFKEGTSRRIADILARASLSPQKRFVD